MDKNEIATWTKEELMNRENLLEVFAMEDEFERQEYITLMLDRAKTLKFKKDL